MKYLGLQSSLPLYDERTSLRENVRYTVMRGLNTLNKGVKILNPTVMYVCVQSLNFGNSPRPPPHKVKIRQLNQFNRQTV